MQSAMRGCVLFVCLPFAVVGLILLLFLGTEDSSAAQASPGMACDPGTGEGGSVAGFSGESLTIAKRIVAIGKQRELPQQAWQIALQAGMTESRLRNLDYGDRDSRGIFQMRPSMGWGTPEQLQDINYQVNKFYDVLEELPDWEEMRPGDAAQAVERSAFPDRYHKFEDAAKQVIGNVEGVTCSEVDGGNVESVLSAAIEQRGTPYAWGGGTVDGPSEGTDIDVGVVGFDCSSLVQYAYHRGTGGDVTLPRTSREQYSATKNRDVGVDELQPGDLLFYGDSPQGIHHVAMYMGENRMVEAPESGKTVDVVDVRTGGDFFAATRVM